MRKYLFIMANEGPPWGGSEPLWSSAAEKLARQGNEVRVSVKDLGKRVPQIENLREAGCKIYSINYSMPPFFTRQIRRIRGIYALDAYRLAHLRRVAEGVDLVIISQGDNDDGLPWMEAAQALRCRYVLIAQSAVVYWWPSDEVAERVARGYESAVRSYFVSQAVLDLSRRQVGSRLENGVVVRNPFNVRYDAQPPWPSDSVDQLSLACVARLDIISKGHDLILDVLGQPRWRGRNIRVSFIGDGPHERALRRIAEESKLTSVRFLGQRDNIEEVWKQHHALVLASRFEGMPLVLVEAMLCGRPGIVTDVGGNRELVRDGANGFLARAPTSALLDEALERAWQSRERLKEIGSVAAHDVRQWVSPDPGGDFADELAAVAANTSGRLSEHRPEHPVGSPR
jgi:glycosyltransferase involved in cell wall biosynthesis